MEFHEKLQELRKSKGLTQEELAQALFVSRTAVSKWESGRGYPNIDSLKAIGKFFSVTVDDLLSGDELLTFAEEHHRQKAARLRQLVFGFVDCSTAMFCFLPFFGQRVNGTVEAVSLLSLTGVSPYLRAVFWIYVAAAVLCGLLMLALQSGEQTLRFKHGCSLSFALNALGVLLFIVSSHPYAAAFLFIFLLLKVFLSAKQP